MTQRIGCIRVSNFPVAARLRGEPELAWEPLAILEEAGAAARVVAVNEASCRLGIRPGATAAQARAIHPGLVLRLRDPEAERAAQEALCEAAESFSPKIEEGGAGIVYLDAEGIGRQFPGPLGERDLARAMVRAAAAVGLPAGAAVAGSKLVAEIAACQLETAAVASGEEPVFLSLLPVAVLAGAISLETTHTLSRWGIRTLGELARLPAAELASRLGDEGRALHRMARGEDPRPLVPRRPPPEFREGINFDWPISELEPFSFVARAVLERLLARLETRGLACRRLEMTLTLEPDGPVAHETRSIDLPGPTRELKTLLMLVRLDLASQPPRAPVTGFVFAAQPDRPRLLQASLFGPTAVSPDKLAGTLARLSALLGPSRFGAPRSVGTHVPERYGTASYDPSPPPKFRPEMTAPSHRIAMRVLRPAVALEVILDPGGRRPVMVQALRRAAAEPAGAVRVASGPWRLEAGWWSTEPAARDYWDLELSDGGLYRIYRDRATASWFADGIYD